MSQESYARAARLVYISRYLIDGPKVALIQAHRVAAGAVAAHPGDDDAAVLNALETATNVLGLWSSGRGWFRGPRLRPVDLTADQREVLERLKAVDYRAARVALFVLLEGAPVETVAAAVLGDERIGNQLQTVREGIATICAGRPPEEIRALLLGRELDPVVVPVSAEGALKRRRRRIRAGGVLTAAVVLLAGAGVWWFGLRVPPLGTYSDDPQVQTQARIFNNDYGLSAWPARGELLSDTALLRRAADKWRAEGLPADVSVESGIGSTGPRVLFAGRVRDIRVVVMLAFLGSASDAAKVGVYTENLRSEKDRFRTEADSRVMVNRTFEADPVGPGAIRLLDPDVYQIDPLLLPPTVTDVATGPLDTPTAGWRPAHPDSHGVLQVPVPQETLQQTSDTHWSPSEGIRFKEPNQNVLITPSATVPETFRDTSPLLPVLGSDYRDDQALSNADWCTIRQDAEISPDMVDQTGYSAESYSDVAGGPLPDGGGTGTVISQNGFGAQDDNFRDLALLSQTGSSCDQATLVETGNRFEYATDGVQSDEGSSFVSPVTSAMVWTSPANRHYLVVAAAPGVAKLRVSGPATGSADGRWLVVPLPYVTDNFGAPSETPLVEAFDAAGHRCGDSDPLKAKTQYCYGS